MYLVILRIPFFHLFLLFISTTISAQNNFYFDQNLEKDLSKARVVGVGNPGQGIKDLDITIAKARQLHNPYYEMLAFSNKIYFYADLNDNKNVLKSADATIDLARKLNIYDKEIEATVKKTWALMHLGLIKEAEQQLHDTYPMLSKLNINSDYDLAIIGNYWNTYHEFYNVQEKDQEAIKKGIKALEYYSKIKDSEDRNRRLIQSYTSLGSSYLFQNKVDSALYYFITAKNLFPYNKFPDKKAQAIIYSGSGMAYNIQKKYTKALPFLIRGLVLSKNNYPDIYSETLNQLSINFKNTKNVQNNPYYKQYIAIKKQNEEQNKLTTEELEKIKNKNNNTFFSSRGIQFTVFILLIILIFIIYVILRKYNKQAKKTKEIIENKTATEFSEILSLAKKNDPAFVKRFQEIYPEFYFNLTSKFPELTATHIKILLYSYLNYTTKDIAVFMNITVRTVQTHKYRIRKIININTDENIVDWTKKI